MIKKKTHYLCEDGIEKATLGVPVRQHLPGLMILGTDLPIPASHSIYSSYAALYPFSIIRTFIDNRHVLGQMGFMGGSRGGQGVRTPPPLKNHKNTGFLCNTGPDPLKNHKATKPAFNVGLSSARQRNAISMALRWRADDGRLIVVVGPSLPSSTKLKRYQIWTISDKTFWIRACQAWYS